MYFPSQNPAIALTVHFGSSIMVSAGIANPRDSHYQYMVFWIPNSVSSVCMTRLIQLLCSAFTWLTSKQPNGDFPNLKCYWEIIHGRAIIHETRSQFTTKWLAGWSCRRAPKQTRNFCVWIMRGGGEEHRDDDYSKSGAYSSDTHSSTLSGVWWICWTQQK